MTHCSNCGDRQAPHQWVMVAVHDRVCSRCAQWYVDRARASRLWTTVSRRRLRIRGLIRSLIPEQSPIGSEAVVTAVLEALHELGGDKPLVPDCQANLFAWGWLPAVVASALQGHPRWPPGGKGADEQAWQDSAQQLTRHGHLLTDQYWATMWAWRQVRPDTTVWKEVGLDRFSPSAAERVPDGGARQDIPDCYALRTFSAEHCDSDGDASSARSVPGRGVNTNEQKSCVIGGGCPFPVEEVFCDGNSNGCRELFLCASCHQGYHYECVRRVGSEEECEGMLDVDAVWRCRLCVTKSNYAVSSLLDSLVDDKGNERSY